MIVAATGHRPNKLGGYDDVVIQRLTFLAVDYLKARPEILTGTLRAISGMALGWDTAWAQAALNLNIPLTVAVPFRGQERRWPSKSQQLYRDIISKATEVVIVCEGDYEPEKMQERNEWMVDHCDRLVALWDGSKGGTGNCVRYAKKFKKPIDNLWTQFTQ